MVPTLNPGDRVVVRRLWRRPGRRLVGALVVAEDPRGEAGLMIKRVAEMRGGSFVLLGDNPGASTDSRSVGAFPAAALRGKVLYRYYPAKRAGWLR